MAQNFIHLFSELPVQTIGIHIEKYQMVKIFAKLRMHSPVHFILFHIVEKPILDMSRLFSDTVLKTCIVEHQIVVADRGSVLQQHPELEIKISTYTYAFIKKASVDNRLPLQYFC